MVSPALAESPLQMINTTQIMEFLGGKINPNSPINNGFIIILILVFVFWALQRDN